MQWGVPVAIGDKVVDILRGIQYEQDQVEFYVYKIRDNTKVELYVVVVTDYLVEAIEVELIKVDQSTVPRI